jgi:hypothetical protein
MAMKIKKLFNDFFNRINSFMRDETLTDLLMGFSFLISMLIIAMFIVFMCFTTYDAFQAINVAPRKFDLNVRTYQLKQLTLRCLNKLYSQNNEVKNEN